MALIEMQQPNFILNLSFIEIVVAILVSMSIIFISHRVYTKYMAISEDQAGLLLNLKLSPKKFSFEELKTATNNFSHKLKLGKGRFGSVLFKGLLPDNITSVAVKKLRDGLIGQRETEFSAEVEILGILNHINVVRLIGYCAEASHRLLVFELMENGSLDRWIFGRAAGTGLDWQTRAKIIAGMAKGLSYLHEECRQKIIHCEITPQSILLDQAFTAKVADFGHARLIDRDDRRSDFHPRMEGIFGYVAPETLASSIMDEKVDVYSFGVVVLEIVCGRRNVDRPQPPAGEENSLLSLLQRKVALVNGLLEMVDRNGIDMRLYGDEAVEMMRLAIWCLQTESRKRPSMATVVKVLEGSLKVETNLDLNFTTSAATLNS